MPVAAPQGMTRSLEAKELVYDREDEPARRSGTWCEQKHRFLPRQIAKKNMDFTGKLLGNLVKLKVETHAEQHDFTGKHLKKHVTYWDLQRKLCRRC
jgi:hypothetical protein